MGQTIQACVSHLECNNFTSSNKIQCGLQYKQVVTVRATLSMQNQNKMMLASYGSAIHALD